MSLEQSIEKFATAVDRLATVGERFLAMATERSGPEPSVRTTVPISPVSPPVEGDGGGAPGADAEQPAKKRGRPAKTMLTVEPAKPAAAAAAVPPVEPTQLTIEQVRAALQAVQAKSDAKTAFGLLTRMGFQALSQLPVEKYSELINAAQTKLIEIQG